MPETYPTVVLKAGREKTILKGHPWLYSGAIEKVYGDPAPGEVVCVTSATGQKVALCFYHPRCDIALRLISRHGDEKIDKSFWQRRIKSALELRKKIVPQNTTAYRLLNAEGDGIPGLVADRYGDLLVISIETAGAEFYRNEIIDALIKEVSPHGIYERSKGPARALEGLEERVGVVWGREPPTTMEIMEHGLRFLVQVKEGQKTGFFLDQRENRRLFQDLSAGARVLNCFSYTGGFTVYAMRGGAQEVVSVDVSESAVIMIDENLKINGLDNKSHRGVRADVFDYLRCENSRYDLICLDPPPFAKARKDVRSAFRGYRDINRLALKMLKQNGLLMTFSCSGALDEETFYQAICQAAAEAVGTVRLLTRLGAAKDHPTLINHPEGRYLKGFVLSLMEKHER